MKHLPGNSIRVGALYAFGQTDPEMLARCRLRFFLTVAQRAF
ncbi:hypothetical protein [Pseudomonas sp. NPDC089569]